MEKMGPRADRTSECKALSGNWISLKKKKDQKKYPQFIWAKMFLKYYYFYHCFTGNSALLLPMIHLISVLFTWSGNNLSLYLFAVRSHSVNYCPHVVYVERTVGNTTCIFFFYIFQVKSVFKIFFKLLLIVYNHMIWCKINICCSCYSHFCFLLCLSEIWIGHWPKTWL